MRVLHVINELGSGGAEKLVTQLCQHASEGIEFQVYLFSDRHMTYGEAIRKAGVPIHVSRRERLKDLRQPWDLALFLKHNRFDIVHVHLFPSLYFGALARGLGKINGSHFIYTEHSTYNKRRDKWWLHPLERRMYSTYDRVTAVSVQAMKQLMNWLGTDILAGKTKVIENGVDIALYQHASGDRLLAELDLPEKTLLCTMISRFSAIKDHRTVIEALALLPSHVHVVLAGEGPEMNTIRELVHSRTLDDRVHFLGFREDIPEILAASDIVIQSSLWEGFGLTAVEGMAAGKPVMASDVPGMREIVQGAGFLFPKGNAKALADLIRNFNQSEWMESGREKALARAANYDLDRMIGDYTDLYSEL